MLDLWDAAPDELETTVWLDVDGRSEVWRHFQRNASKTRARCRVCGNQYTLSWRSTSGLWAHLKTAHGWQAKEQRK